MWKLIADSINKAFHSFLQHKADTLYMNIDERQAEILLNNTVNVTEGSDQFI